MSFFSFACSCLTLLTVPSLELLDHQEWILLLPVPSIITVYTIDWISSCLDKTTTVAEDTGGVTMDTTPIASCPNEWHLAPLEYMIAVVEPHSYIHYENCVVNSTVCKTVWHHYCQCHHFHETASHHCHLFVTIYSCAFHPGRNTSRKIWAS